MASKILKSVKTVKEGFTLAFSTRSVKSEKEEEWDGKYDYCIVLKKNEQTEKAQLELKATLENEFPGVKVWVDLNGANVEEGIHKSRNIILFLTSGFAKHETFLGQMRLAQELNKHIILLQETLATYDGPGCFNDLLDECPQDVKGMLTRSHPDTWVEWFRAKPKDCAARINKVSLQDEEKKKIRHFVDSSNSSGGFIYEREDQEGIPVLDESMCIFAALCGVSLPGAGPWTRKWTVASRLILSGCAVLCLTRLGTTEGPGFLDYATIIQISADHPALVVFLVVALLSLNSDDVVELVLNRISSARMVKRVRFNTRVATVIAAILTVSLTIWGWVGYLPGFFSSYYLTNSTPGLVVYGLIHGATWILILPLFFGGLFASLLILFTVQDLSFCGVLSTFDYLHSDIQKVGLRAIVAKGKELTIANEDYGYFTAAYNDAWELNKRIQRRCSIPFKIFWILEICLMAWSIWSLTQGFDADYEDVRVSRLQNHWNLLVRLTWFMGHSLWFGAGAIIVGFLPWGVNFYSIRLRQQCSKLKLSDPELKNKLLGFIKSQDLTIRSGILYAPMWTLPIFIGILTVNILGYNADVARLLGAY